ISKIIEKNNIKIGLLGYNGLFAKNTSLIVNEIKKIKSRSDFVIVFPHWGVEYEKTPNDDQKNTAKAFIDAGADLIIGTHPHVIQSIETYKNKFIFYSLGNFIFDQYFSESTMEGLSVGILLQKKQNKIQSANYLFPINITKKSQPELAQGKTKEKILKELSEISEVDENIKASIRDGNILRL
ncbi:MAG: CapA family protein, partial [Candidatus Firestonebacteria bacterium]|nr:CapA family protein [Candidatus Firestonebacteria bacterium]